ncbi:MAG: cytochrome-c peroxidase, partial [Catalinimonas sp.]
MKAPAIICLLALSALSCADRSAPFEVALSPTLADSLPDATRNPLTEAGVSLGKQLFFDPALSVDGRVSCASCHEPARAFTDGQRTSTRGVTGRPLVRHTPTLANLAWA